MNGLDGTWMTRRGGRDRQEEGGGRKHGRRKGVMMMKRMRWYGSAVVLGVVVALTLATLGPNLYDYNRTVTVSDSSITTTTAAILPTTPPSSKEEDMQRSLSTKKIQKNARLFLYRSSSSSSSADSNSDSSSSSYSSSSSSFVVVREYEGPDSAGNFTLRPHVHRMVEFYSPYCGHCQVFAATYRRVAEQFIVTTAATATFSSTSSSSSSSSSTNNHSNSSRRSFAVKNVDGTAADVEFYAVSCAAYPDVCQRFAVRSWPTLLSFPAVATAPVPVSSVSASEFSVRSRSRNHNHNHNHTTATTTTTTTTPLDDAHGGGTLWPWRGGAKFTQEAVRAVFFPTRTSTTVPIIERGGEDEEEEESDPLHRNSSSSSNNNNNNSRSSRSNHHNRYMDLLAEHWRRSRHEEEDERQRGKLWPGEDLMRDATLSFMEGLRVGVFPILEVVGVGSGSPAPPENNDVIMSALQQWLYLLRRTLPHEWTVLHPLITHLVLEIEKSEREVNDVQNKTQKRPATAAMIPLLLPRLHSILHNHSTAFLHQLQKGNAGDRERGTGGGGGGWSPSCDSSSSSSTSSLSTLSSASQGSPSQPQPPPPHVGGGFTCGFWKLLHVMSVGLTTETETEPDADESENMFADEAAAARVVRAYMTHFFPCTECATHFLDQYDQCANASTANANHASAKNHRRCIIRLKKVEDHMNTMDVDAEDDDSNDDDDDDYGKKALALWLWQVHNDVSVRLVREKRQRSMRMIQSMRKEEEEMIGSDETAASAANVTTMMMEEEIAVLFPSIRDCRECYFDDGRWNNDAVFLFLKQQYWPAATTVPIDNRTTRLLMNKSDTEHSRVMIWVFLLLLLLLLLVLLRGSRSGMRISSTTFHDMTIRARTAALQLQQRSGSHKRGV